jgi:hypothetical protein
MRFNFVQTQSGMKRIFLFFLGFGMSASLTAQQTDSEIWQPDYNEDKLLSMPDLLPLLGRFGSEWTLGNREGEAPLPMNIAVLDWSGQENEALILRATSDLVVLKAGINDGSDPGQRSTNIRHIKVESWLPSSAPQNDLETFVNLPMKSQVLLLDPGQDANGQPMPFGTRYILHFPDGTKGELSTNSTGSMSVSGKSLRTMAQLLHAGGQVYFMP